MQKRFCFLGENRTGFIKTKTNWGMRSCGGGSSKRGARPLSIVLKGPKINFGACRPSPRPSDPLHRPPKPLKSLHKG
jgi:hypothetical protein